MDKKQVAAGMAWSFSGNAISLGVNFIVSIILARLLMPEAFGLVAVTMIFINIALQFFASGFGSALIQKKDADETDYSTIFYFNLVFSVALFVLIYFLAPVFAGMFDDSSYDNAKLIQILRVTSVSVIALGVTSVQRSIVIKNLQFRKLFFVDLSAAVLSGTVGVVMAYSGFGVWALVWQTVTSSAVTVAVLTGLGGWRPKAAFSWQRLKPLFSYGWKLTASSFLTTIYTETSSLVIGLEYQAADLAYFKKGMRFPQLIVSNVLAAINIVLFPAMSKLETIQEQKAFLRHANRLSTFIVFPVVLGLAGVGGNLVTVLLTDKWADSVVFLQIACIAFFLQPIAMTNLQALKAIGMSGRYLLLDIIKKAVGFSLIITAVILKKGPVFIALADVAAAAVALVVSMIPVARHIGYGMGEQIKDVMPQTLLAILMTAVVYFVGLIPLNINLVFVLQILTGVLFYAGSAYLLKMPEFRECLALLKRKKTVKEE